MAGNGGVGTSGVVVAVSQRRCWDERCCSGCQWKCWDERCCSGCESVEVLGRAVL